jgi:hypothetical protein
MSISGPDKFEQSFAPELTDASVDVPTDPFKKIKGVKEGAQDELADAMNQMPL